MNVEIRDDVRVAGSEEADDAVGFFAWLRRALPTAFVLLFLGGIAVWGHMTEWEFGWHIGTSDGAESARSVSPVTIAYGTSLPNSAELPAALRRAVALRYPSADTVEQAGIDIAPVWTSPMTEAISASGELSFDPNRTARLASRANGSVWKVLKTVGAAVQNGEVIALIDAMDVGKAKSEVQSALVQFRLKQKAVANAKASGGAIPERQQREVEAALRDAEVRLMGTIQSLVNLGLPIRVADFDRLSLPEIVQRLRGLGVPTDAGFDAESGTANLLPVRAPFAGQILAADAVGGEVVEAGRVIFVIVDPQKLWLTMHVPQEQAKRIVLNQVIRFRPDGTTDEVTSKVAWIGTTADETTRTVPIRAEVVNDKKLLRASTLGQGRIVVRETAEAVVVPKDAVQMIHGTTVVFVRHVDFLKPDGPKEFLARIVRVGANDAINSEILSGLQRNEIVATKGANVLANELNRLAQ